MAVARFENLAARARLAPADCLARTVAVCARRPRHAAAGERASQATSGYFGRSAPLAAARAFAWGLVRLLQAEASEALREADRIARLQGRRQIFPLNLVAPRVSRLQNPHPINTP